jgi:tetratricopeptide (TPR) repeat protein
MIESRIDESAVLKEAQALKGNATALRNLEDYDKAQQSLDKAIALLSSALDEVRPSAPSARELRAALADTFGMKGGVFRRSGDIAAALAAYREGRSLEDIDKESTYNLSNVIALSVTAEGRSPSGDPALRKDIESAIERLERATKGSRKDEWWAWSDLAQFYLLHNEPDMARLSYTNGKEAGPTKKEIQRSIAILEELAGCLTVTAPEIAANIRTAITKLSEWLRRRA